MLQKLGELLLSMGWLTDTADYAGSVLARLAWLRSQVATYFSTTITAAGPAAAVLLDSGQLTAGAYEVEAFAKAILGTGSATAWTDLEYRNAANNGNNQKVHLALDVSGADSSGHIRWPRIEVATNERVRINLAANTSAPCVISASLHVRPV